MSAGKDRKFKPVPSSMVPVTKCHSVGTMSTLRVGDGPTHDACRLKPETLTPRRLLVAAKSRTIEEISYPQYLLVFLMFLFCGVFCPLATLRSSSSSRHGSPRLSHGRDKP